MDDMTESQYIEIVKMLTKLDTRAEQTNEHLKTLNGKVAKNVADIASLEKQNIRDGSTHTKLEDYMDREEKKTSDKRKFWYERLAWAAVIVGISILQGLGIINFSL